MIDDISISERDLFNFVFFNQLLSQGKRIYLENHQHEFEQIEFYRMQKRKINSDIDSKTNLFLASKISVYELPRVIKLYPLKEELMKKKNKLSNSVKKMLKAESDKDSQTFVYEEYLFVIRIVKENKTRKIHLFSDETDVMNEIKMILHPGDRQYILENFNDPIEVDDLQKVESITLEII